MALNSRSALHPKWLTHNNPVASGFYFATIEIFDPNASAGTYNATTNEWTSARTVLWTGKARVQAVREAIARDVQSDPSSFQMFEVHIDMQGNTLAGSENTMPDIRANHQLFVTDSPYDESIEGYIFVITGTLSTSNPWGKMLQCEVDQEVKRVVSP